MVKIRLKREGRKKIPHYQIVISDSRSPRDGKFIEKVGSYHPVQEIKILKIDESKMKYWLSKGAQPTKSVHKLLAKVNIIPSLVF